MKFSSLSAWFSESVPGVKSILLFGNDEELCLFRLQWLKTYYQFQGYQLLSISSEEELQVHLFENDLFHQNLSQNCIVYSEATESTLRILTDFLELENTSHKVLMIGKKVTNKSKLVQFYQNNFKTGAIGCYERSTEEIKSAIQKYGVQHALKIDPLALDQLSYYLTDHPLEFFSLLEMLSIYCENNIIKEEEVKENLTQSNSLQDIGAYFILQQSENLHSSLTNLDPSEYVSIVRKIIQDVMALITLNIHNIKPESIKNFWLKNTKKIIYPRIPLYQSALNKWSLKRCGEALSHLLEIEIKLKSSSALSVTQISHTLTSFLNVK